jgi:hypothetical protein
MIDEVFIPGCEDDTISTTEIRSIVKKMQSANGDEAKYLPPFRTFLKKTAQSAATLSNGIYTVMDNDGYYYAGWGTSVYKVGDVRKDDVHSPIEIVKSYDIRDGLPKDQRDKISRIMGFGMTYDGYLRWGKKKETKSNRNYPTHSRLRCAILRRGLRPKNASFVSNSPLVISSSLSPDFRTSQ